MRTPANALNAALDGRYRIERELGAGGMATVYLARDLRHDREVALKVLRADLVGEGGSERFSREVAIAARLQHPHILTLIDSGEAAGVLFYVMPYVNGESLRARIARDGRLPLGDTLRILRDIADALVHAEAHGVVHRDIKPENVMLAGGHAMLVDFGVAKALRLARATDTLTSVGVSLGTPTYMAPEQIAGDTEVDSRADLYSLGVVAYEMLTGQPPFTGSVQAVMRAHVMDEPPALVAARPDASKELIGLVARCLNKAPGERFARAADLLATIDAAQAALAVEMAPPVKVKGLTGTLAFAVGAVAVAIMAVVFGWRAVSHARDVRWVSTDALPELQRLATALENDSAFALAVQVRAIVGDDPAVNVVWERVAATRMLASVPAGAVIWRAPFGDTTRWERLGVAGTDSVTLPRVRHNRLKLELPGYRTAQLLFPSGPRTTSPYRLDAESAPHAEMVHVSDGDAAARLPGLDQLTPVRLSDFLIGRHEVTNREYRAFVLAGGYTDPSYWTEPFRRERRLLRRAQAMSLLVDRTGRPGPATWEGGDVPRGEEELPVSGVSWYEAAAYARWAGLALPTAYHWSRAADMSLGYAIVPGSNLDGKGPRPGSTTVGMSAFGAFDMAGNVREWIENADADGKRYIFGGGWTDPIYSFNDAYAQDPFDRSASNGVRVIKYLRDERPPAAATATLVRDYRDYDRERTASSELVASYRRMFDYDPLPLDVKVESRDTTAADWITERVSFTAAYGGERMSAFLFTPRRGTPPYQVVVHFPGDQNFGVRSMTDMATGNAVDFFMRSGRAVLYPVYKGVGDRSDSLPSSIPNMSIEYRDHVIMWGKDLRRALDFAESRPDLDVARTAYFGVSWGGRMGGLVPAIEPRIGAVVLFVAGLRMQRARPEADPFNYLSRILQPTLMLNATNDDYFPVETSQKPFFRRLGTRAADKRYVLYAGGHVLPRTQLIAESLAWLDKYLGPVR